ncbi:WD40/YVTN/BNR-like repeat-containing protein [Aestuariibaculum suncheonense]|uniref:Oxidoreductase n=1 Tax=Aestuariibaculum suncheonense TaxID=1028745 RepID=A0A8J6Q5K9_9FLAO|nr:oxidoreductase [Aestuariibaculum suncheonense]MBD0834649.1 oxidoreductase [Aestuariibaculum suncheonense]
MKQLFVTLLLITTLYSCQKKAKLIPRDFKSVEVEDILEDSLLSVRAIEILNDKSLAFAANNSMFGLYNPNTKMWQTSVQQYDSLNLHFRAVAHTATDFFMLSIENPALLYKTGDDGRMQLVYKEAGEGVFYDAMTFWNDAEGIAVGDSVDGCISIIITRDGGDTWNKIPCSELPKLDEGESAFAASNSNIAINGDSAWVATSHGNIYYTEDKGVKWTVSKSPMIQDAETEGIYSIDFYDENLGFAIGGDFTKPDANKANKIKTVDGGKTWNLVADGQIPGYRSCVQFLRNREGKELVAVGFKGVDYSKDGGVSWNHISDESFYTIRFINDSIAYAGGAKRISKLTFRE